MAPTSRNEILSALITGGTYTIDIYSGAMGTPANAGYPVANTLLARFTGITVEVPTWGEANITNSEFDPQLLTEVLATGTPTWARMYNGLTGGGGEPWAIEMMAGDADSGLPCTFTQVPLELGGLGLKLIGLGIFQGSQE